MGPLLALQRAYRREPVISDPQPGVTLGFVRRRRCSRWRRRAWARCWRCSARTGASRRRPASSCAWPATPWRRTCPSWRCGTSLNSTLYPSPLKHVQNDYASAAEQRVHDCQCIHGIMIRGSWEFSWMPSRKGGPAHLRHGCCVILSACLHEQKSSPWRSAKTGDGQLRV